MFARDFMKYNKTVKLRINENQLKQVNKDKPTNISRSEKIR